MRVPRAVAEWVVGWWGGGGGAWAPVANVVLAPAEWTFRAAVRVRNRAYDRGWLAAEHAPLPVLSVGNLGVGGAGKTPFAAWLVGDLRRHRRAPAVVLRGYGDDEVRLHRELNPDVPVFADPARAYAAQRAAASGCDVVVLDDGFQHRALHRDLDLVLIGAEGWTTRRRLLPRGPWREGTDALRRASVVVLTWKTDDTAVERVRAQVEDAARAPTVGCRIAPAGLRPLHGGQGDSRQAPALAGTAVLAVAGLADPGPFAANLLGAGARVELAAFPDHHEFTARDAETLLRRSQTRPLVMTHKDAVKLGALLPADSDAWVLTQRVSIAWGADRLDAAVAAALDGWRQ